MNNQTTTPAALSRRIVTHSGSAHRDEVVSIALLLAADDTITSVARVNDVPPADLNNPSVYVLDTGRCHDPDRLNFDHHQFDSEEPPRSTLSLVLAHLGLDAAARRCWPWLEAFERLDTGGPDALEKFFDVPGLAFVLPMIRPPLEDALLDIFSMQENLGLDDQLFQVMRTVGRQLHDELQTIPELLDWYAARVIAKVAVPKGINVESGQPLEAKPEWIREIILVKWPEAPNALARKAFEIYLRENAPDARLTVTPDERGPGWVFTSVSNKNPVDFRVLAGDPEIAVIHSSGFMAATKTRDNDVVERLLKRLEK